MEWAVEALATPPGGAAMGEGGAAMVGWASMGGDELWHVWHAVR